MEDAWRRSFLNRTSHGGRSAVAMLLAAGWSRVRVPTYVRHGAFDWIMSREDSELISTYVNKNGDLASFYEIPDTGHTFQHYLSLADAFKGKKARFDPKMIGLLADWLQNKAITHED